MTPLCVAPELIDKFWPHVRSFIDMAYWSGNGDDSADVIYLDLMRGLALLWVVWDDDSKQIACAVVTKLIKTEKGKICLIAACAGNRMHKWLHLLEVIEKYARDEQCQFIRFSGRRGWSHFFRSWYEPFVTLEKEL